MYRDDEKPPTRRSAGSTKELVTMTVRYDDKLEMPLKGDEKNGVTAEVELTATSSTSVREPLDLVVVMDMGEDDSGVPRKNMDEMKKAMQFVIMKLTPVDRLSIVTFKMFGSTRMCPLLCMSEAGKNRAKAIINGLAPESRPVGSMDAVDTGVAVVEGRVHTTGRTANIFVMSWNNSIGLGGLVILEKLGKVPIYTFGFGKNIKKVTWWLHLLAKYSLGGTCSFVPDGASLTVAISQLLGGLLTVVAQDVEFILTPARDHPRDLREAVVGNTYTYTYNNEIEDKATGVTRIRFGNLFSGESRKFVVLMTLLDSTATAPYDAELAYARCSYTAQGSVGGHQAPHVLQTKRTANPAAAAHSTLQDQERARIQYTRAINITSLSKPDEAKYKLVNAQNALADVLASAESHETLAMRRAELRRMLQFVGYSEELFKETGEPYAYACTSSHERRRFAARGDDIGTLRFYATPRMETYLQQARQFERNPAMQLPTADDDDAKENAARIKS